MAQEDVMITIKSPAFSPYGKIPIRYTCDGEDVNPPILIGNVPNEAKSLALIIEDPDGPLGTWTHWIVFNINVKTKGIQENSTPNGASLGLNDSGVITYEGPCPPGGIHNYSFKIFALDQYLNISQKITRKEFYEAIKGHIIDTGELTAEY